MTMQMEGKKLGGRYEVLNRVGGGGMAVVYRAKDILLNRHVAIKVLNESLSNDSEFIRRFSREAQAAASLSHHNIVNVYDVGKDGYTHYIVMELVTGPTLKEHIQKNGPLPVKEAAQIAIQICDGLAHAHDAQIVHRDIKPHNILLGTNGQVKVTDFGIARAASSSTITQTGSVMGSVHYFSPEQARGGVIGAKSDIYSLGVVFYEMLTGQLPYDGDSAISIALKHLQETPIDPREVNPQIPESMINIVMRALEKDPSMRYTSARAMMQDIQYAVQNDLGVEPSWPGYRSGEQKELFQTIPLSMEETAKHTAVSSINGSDYQSPTQRPEVRGTGPATAGQRSSHDRTVSEETMMNLERLRGVGGNDGQTIFQRTAVWLDDVQQKMSWWQKLLFGMFTFLVIIVLAAWGVFSIWGLISAGEDSPTGGEPPTANGGGQELVMPAFENLDEAKAFAKKNGMPEPEVSYVEGESGEVIDQTPAEDAELTPSTKIVLKVGAGEEAKGDVNYIGLKESNLKYGDIASGKKVRLLWCNDPNAGVAAHVVYDQRLTEEGIIEVKSYTPSITQGQCSPAKYNQY
ncbi:Stk1 family PASTA domain-containing Ser/Thr kinase [Hazenella sp. IB182353]|nr:Stk1 family PASTA domain-containing Ser/Thr kinase [Polycladospora coralii]